MDELKISEKDQRRSEEKFDQEARDQEILVNQLKNLELSDQTLQKKMFKQKIKDRNLQVNSNIGFIEPNNNLNVHDQASEKQSDISIQSNMKDGIPHITQEHKSPKNLNILIKIFDKQQAFLISCQLEKENCELYEIIGYGEEGLVFSGKWEQKDCAVKVCFIDSDEHLADIRKEFNTIIQMENQLNTIKYYRYLEILEEQIAIIIMEKGKKALKDEINQRMQKQNLFSVQELLKIVLDLFDGLVELKNYSILHLDIKPGNYIFTDFGISQVISTYNTYTQEFKGYTEKYASPEQNLSKDNEGIMSNQEAIDLQNDKIIKVNHLSDIFSLGKVFLFLIEINEKIKIKQNDQLNNFELFLRKFTQEYMTLDDYRQRLNTNLLSIYFIASLLNLKIDVCLTDQIDKIKNQKLNMNHLKSASDLQLLENFGDNIGSAKIQFTQEIEDLENKGFLKIFCNLTNQINITLKANNQQPLFPYKMNMIFYNNSYLFNQLTYLVINNANRMQLFNMDQFKTFLELCNNYYFLFEERKSHEEAQSILEMLVDEYDINNYYIIHDILLFLTKIGKTKLQLLFTQLELNFTKCFAHQCFNFEFGFINKYIKTQIQNISMLFSQKTKRIMLDTECFTSMEYKSFNKGYLYYGLEDYENSLFYFTDALSNFEKLKSFDAEIATCQNCIGILYTKFHHYDQALEMHQSSLAIRKSIFPENHVDIAISLNNISYVLSHQGNHDLAFTLQKESYKVLNASIQSCTQISKTISNNFYEIMIKGKKKFTLNILG